MWAGVNATDGMKAYGKTVAEVTKRNIAAYIAEGIAAAMKNSMKLGPIGLAAAPFVGGMAAAAFSSAIPSFGDGGAAFGPTLALVGEAPGISKSNPEYIGTAEQLGLNKRGFEQVRFMLEGDNLKGSLDAKKKMEIYF